MQAEDLDLNIIIKKYSISVGIMYSTTEICHERSFIIITDRVSATKCTLTGECEIFSTKNLLATKNCLKVRSGYDII